MLSGICGYIGQIFGGCIGNIVRDARDEAQDLLVQSVNERVKPKWLEFIKNVIKWLCRFLKTAFRFIYGLSHEIQTVEKEHLITIEKYLNSVKFDAGPEEREYKTNILYIRRCFRESIDSFHLLEQRRTRLYDEGAQASSTWGKIKKHLQLAVPHFKLLKQRYHIASTVIEMIEELPAVNDLDNHSITKPRLSDPRTLFTAQDKDLVGLDGPKSELIKLLDLDIQVHKGLHLVAVAGQGGVGKTTLVRKVYHQFKNGFQLCALVTVSQSYDPADKLKDILAQFQKSEEIPDEWKNLGANEIAEKLSKFLSTNPKKRYIVVLDDVWDTGLIDLIRYALESDKAGSIAGRILITSREEGKIANQWAQKLGGNVFIHHPLSENDAFRLLCNRLFAVHKDVCDNKQKQNVLHQILRSCPLLPLIIRALAGVLCGLQDWNTVRDHLGREFKKGDDYENTKRILLYSYYDLPEELKSCFLYFGMFPEDHDIDVDQLFRIWIADGFMERSDDYTPEEVAQSHMKTLVDRGLVIISSDDGSPTSYDSLSPIKTFKRSAKVHDIFHKIIRDELQNDNFSQVVSDDNSSTISIDGKFERFSVYPTRGTFNVEFTPSNGRRCLGFRSIILNSSTALFLDRLLRLPHTATNSLRVLHLESNKAAINGEIPNEVGCLDNLRLLRLTMRYSHLLPEFIGNLQNLETLDIFQLQGLELTRLPQNIKRLSKLQHLIISPRVPVPLGVLENLTDLHTLTSIKITEPGVVQELRKLHRLRTLSVQHTKVADLPTFWQALMNMVELRLLHVVVSDQVQVHSNLMNIQVPEGLKFLPCLEKLKMILQCLYIRELNFGSANKFNNLQVLIINGLFVGSIGGELPSLQKLHLTVLNKPLHIENHIRQKTLFCIP